MSLAWGQDGFQRGGNVRYQHVKKNKAGMAISQSGLSGSGSGQAQALACELDCVPWCIRPYIADGEGIY